MPVTVHLVRHGETIGYETDAGLTERGRGQAREAAGELATALASRVMVRHSPRARARETAQEIAAQLSRLALPSITHLGGPTVHLGFDNFHIWSDGAEDEVTAAFGRYARRRDSAGSDGTGWVIEADRFWAIHHGGGDPIGHWLTQPLQHFEPPVVVVRRFWSAVTALADGPADHVVVVTHSGPMRALAAHALGHDPGEPDHLEVIRIAVAPTDPTALVHVRGRAIRLDIPVRARPSWFAEDRAGVMALS